MAEQVTLEHKDLKDPSDDKKPRTVTVRESAARVLESGDRGWKRAPKSRQSDSSTT